MSLTIQSVLQRSSSIWKVTWTNPSDNFFMSTLPWYCHSIRSHWDRFGDEWHLFKTFLVRKVPIVPAWFPVFLLSNITLGPSTSLIAGSDMGTWALNIQISLWHWPCLQRISEQVSWSISISMSVCQSVALCLPDDLDPVVRVLGAWWKTVCKFPFLYTSVYELIWIPFILTWCVVNCFTGRFLGSLYGCSSRWAC